MKVIVAELVTTEAVRRIGKKLLDATHDEKPTEIGPAMMAILIYWLKMSGRSLDDFKLWCQAEWDACSSPEGEQTIARHRMAQLFPVQKAGKA